ncbi:MAG: Hsp70 family protein [Pseudomonadota bacterium]
MPGRLAIDFGTSNTRVGVWDSAMGGARTVALPDVSRAALHEGADGERIEVPYIPSLIAYAGKQVWIGRQVEDKGLLRSEAAFRWMKRYISSRLELPRRIEGRSVKFSEAGSDFLVRVLVYAAEAIDLGDEEVAFSAPVEAFEHYQDWLAGVCERAGIARYRLVDEASAAALGYGVHVTAGGAFMVFDFGGGTLDVSIVRVEPSPQGGKRCTVLGKGGAEVGGSVIDNWLYRHVLEVNDLQPEDVRHLSNLLLLEVERAKETLTWSDRTSITVADPDTGEVIGAELTRSSFEDLLEQNGLFETVQRTVNRALSEARERGYDGDHIQAVLLAGGSSLIPSVRRSVRQMFGARVKAHRPLDATVLGAAAFVSGMDFYDHIQHSYALRYYDREKGDHEYLSIVPAGTPYPSDGPIRQVMVRASYDGQEHLGLDIFELADKDCFVGSGGAGLDLVFDPSGGVRFRRREASEVTGRFWINEKCPTFIQAMPPAERGDKRFPVSFSVDGNRRLCVTVRDIRTGRTILKDHPLIKLT